jgi:hypothetical protein
MDTFLFSLSKVVRISVSGEVGEIIGRAEYTNSEPLYFVRYKAADGRAVESWWAQSSIEAVE